MEGYTQLNLPLATWWGRMFGIRPEEIPADARMEFIFTNAPHSWGVFVLLAIVLFARGGLCGLLDYVGCKVGQFGRRSQATEARHD